MPEPYFPPATPPKRARVGMVARLRAAPPWVPWSVAVLVTGASLYGVVWGFIERARLIEQAEKAKAATAATLAAKQEVEKELAPLKADKAGIASEKASLAAARASLTKELKIRADQETALKTAAARLRESMKREISRGDVQLSESKGRLQVGVVDRILFNRGAVSLSARGESVLAHLGAALSSPEAWQIQVAGHTDNTPVESSLRSRYPTNWELSLVHSATVVRFLQERATASPDHMVASGHGEYQPVASNQLAAGRAKNRRIELVVTPAPSSPGGAGADKQATAAKPSSK